MATSMPSEELQLLIAGYVLGDLSLEEAAAFERLLASDPAIAAEVQQMQSALEVSYAVPEITPPAHLRARILTAAGADEAEIRSRAERRSRRRLPWRTGLEVAAAALIVALGIHSYLLEKALKAAQKDAPQRAMLTYALAATQTNSQASAQIVVNPNDLKAKLIVKNLPPLPPGKIYALWTVLVPDAPFTTDAKKAILTEVFQVDEQGNLTQAIAVPKAYQSSGLVKKIAVSIEDATSPQKHRGTPIMVTGS